MAGPQISQLGMMELLSQAGLMAKFVLGVLLGTSILCWAIIVGKWKTLKVARNQNDKFMTIFWNGKNVEEILSKCDKLTESPIALAFKFAVKELRKVSTSNDPQSTLRVEKLENVQRALVRASSHE